MFILTFPVGKLKQEGFKMVWVLARIQTWKIWLISRPMLELQTISLSFSYAIFCNKDKTFYTITYAVRNSSLCTWSCLFSMAFDGAYVCLIRALARMQTVHNKSVTYSCFLPA